MAHRRARRGACFLALVCCVLLLPRAGQAATKALEPPHDPSNTIDCQSCHAVVPAFIPLRERQETVCKSCHNPTGQAAALTEVAGHVVMGGMKLVDCGSCHDPHRPSTTTDPHAGGQTADNLRLVRGDTGKYVLGALEPAIFQQRPVHFAFGDADPPWNGICQSCHTETSHHTQDATADHQHQVGEDCTSCHAHGNGFLPTGGGGDCVACHSGPQDNGDGVPLGGRRAVVGEFPSGDAGLHAHFGPGLDADACLVCHSVGTHMDGFVELVDPDDGSIYRFVVPEDLASDPDTSTFCANCHDADGAQRLPTPLDPFGNGNTPPDVRTRFQGTLQWQEWYGDFCFGQEGTLRGVNSHHDISDSDQAWSGAKIECMNCHGAHNASAATPIADPFDTTTPWSGTENVFCLTCHDGGNGPLDPALPPGVIPPPPTVCRGETSSGTACTTDAECTDGGTCEPGLRGLDTCDYVSEPWYVDYTWTHSAHGLDSKRSWNGYSGAPGYELDCTVCHDPHGSYTPSNTAGNPYMIRDFVDGTAFVDDGTRTGGLLGPPWDTVGAARDVVVTISGVDVDWGSSQSLCSVCHSTWLGAYDWHSYCTGCQTCHAHGQAFGEYDFVEPRDDIPCPVVATTTTTTTTTTSTIAGATAVRSAASLPSQHGTGEPALRALHRGAPHLLAPAPLP